MRYIAPAALAVASMLLATAADAASAGLCSSVKAAWTAARADPASAKGMHFPGADRCSFSDSDLRCFWIFPTKTEARRNFGVFSTTLAACLAPLGLTAVHEVLSGVETTSLRARSDRDPNVDVLYPAGKSLVGVAIVTAQ